MRIEVEDFIINNNSKTFIIAEAGVNHNGDMSIAKELIDVASKANVDAIKFQTFKTEHLILQNVIKAPYQQKTTDSHESQYEMLKRLEVTQEQNNELKRYCIEKGVIFLTTPFDEVSLDELDSLDLPAYKVASTDITNLPFLKKIAKKQKPIFLSTGMSYLDEIELALQEIYSINPNIILLHCSANYPLEDDQVNLKVLNTFREKYNILIGYSDHTVGIGASPYAVAMGAKVVEKHFTISRSLEGPDHKASLTPDELIEYVNEIRKVEKFLGTNIKYPTLAELKTRNSLQKCLVAATNIKKGEYFTEKNITSKRTGGNGISPIYYSEVMGKKANKDYLINDILEL
jgi:N,N'-diacetyllegionaminate synthase